MAQVGWESRSRIAIEWWETEAEARERAEQVLNGPGVDNANIGIVQCGRDTGFDRVVDGKKQFAVVTP